MRRCDSMAKESSSNSAARVFRSCRSHGNAFMFTAPSNNRTSSPSTANRKAVARNSGARKTRSFADTVSMNANPMPAANSLKPSNMTDTAKLNGASLVAMPQGIKTAKPMHA